MRKKIAIFIVAYNASSTIVKVLERIPSSVWETVEEVFIFDDASHDQTHLAAEQWKNFKGLSKLTVIRNPSNLGYGGNQKLGYEYAIKKGYDIVVLLHGDGQYAPEALPEILAPLVEGQAEAVFGSRMLKKGAARAGGMPLYKYIGNKILTKFENWATGAKLSEWHSGYRAYSMRGLSQIPFHLNTNDFHFDSEIIIQLLDRKFRITEVPIPTYYGDEICYVNGMKYAGNLFKVISQYKIHKIGWRSYPKFALEDGNYEIKRSPYSSHALVQKAVESNASVLDLGCEAEMAKGLISKGCKVTGVNLRELTVKGMERFIVHDLEQPLPLSENEKYDYIICADVLEHLRNASGLLVQAKQHLAPNGRIILSTGNVALWVIRLSLLLGKFDYGRRGILDETHVRLYTLKSFKALIGLYGFKILSIQGTAIPFELLFSRHAQSWWVKFITLIYAGFAKIWKRMFAFQFVVVAEIDSGVLKPEVIKLN